MMKINKMARMGQMKFVCITDDEDKEDGTDERK
jgi:hypothetical protein